MIMYDENRHFQIYSPSVKITCPDKNKKGLYVGQKINYSYYKPREI